MSEEIRVQRDVRDLDPSNSSDTGMVSRTGAAAATAREEVVESPTEIRPVTGKPEPMAPLFSGNETQGLHSRWETLQVSFVDEPRHAVEEAERLVTETISMLSKGFAAEREKLEQQWHRGEDVSTEDLRLVLRRYRSFFERLLSI
jgi:hypothetical protein